MNLLSFAMLQFVRQGWVPGARLFEISSNRDLLVSFYPGFTCCFAMRLRQKDTFYIGKTGSSNNTNEEMTLVYMKNI